jgi:hypothetical protein
MTRHLIGDLSDTPTYDDSRIQQAVVVAGLISAQEYPFDTEYTFDLDEIDISPDPTNTATLDRSAMALFTLKAACMLNMNSYQSAVGTGIRVRDGDSEVDTTGSFKGYKDILEIGPCASYTKLLNKLSQNKSMNAGKAISTPASTDFSGFWGRESIADFFDYLRY